MGIIIAPIIGGKAEAWKQWSKELTGKRAQEMKDLNKRYGLKRHSAWLANTPTGPAAVVLHEGSGATTFLEKIGKSNNEFDVWFRGKVKEFHDMDLTQPPKDKPAELFIDSTD